MCFLEIWDIFKLYWLNLILFSHTASYKTFHVSKQAIQPSTEAGVGVQLWKPLLKTHLQPHMALQPQARWSTNTLLHGHLHAYMPQTHTHTAS